MRKTLLPLTKDHVHIGELMGIGDYEEEESILGTGFWIGRGLNCGAFGGYLQFWIAAFSPRFFDYRMCSEV